MHLDARLAEFRSVLLARKVGQPKPAVGLDADVVADAMAAALSRFTDSEGALKVRINNGGSQVGGPA